MLPSVHCTIDGHSVEMRDWRASVELGGYGGFSAELTEKRARQLPSSVTAGATVKLWTQGGTCIYEGLLASDPSFQNGIASINASGHKSIWTKNTKLIFVQSRFPDEFEDGADPPFSFTTNMEIEAEPRGQSLWWRIPGNGSVAYSSGDLHSLALWPEGGVVFSRYAFDIVKRRNSSVEEVRVQRFTGPSGGRTAIATHGLGGADATAIDQSFASGEDALSFEVRYNAASTPATNQVVKLTNLRINGEATTDDTFTGQELLQLLCSKTGFDDSGVSSNLSTNILPLVWSDTHESAADYAVMLHDGWYLVLDDRGSGPYVEADTWADSDEWTCSLADGARHQLTPISPMSGVTVSYSNLRGKERELVFDADPDLGSGEYYDVELEDPQPNSTLATSVGNAVNVLVSVKSWAGPVEATKLRDPSGREATYEVLPGRKLTISDFDMGASFTGRIHTVELRPDGVTAGIEQPSDPVDQLVNLAANRKARRRHPVRKKKGRRNRK